MKKRHFALATLVMILGIFLASPIPCSAEPWKDAFSRLCGYTEDAGTLPTEELGKIIAECETLLGDIEKLDVPDKKVYLFRLQKCRNFYQYTLELRNR
jgi:hypothetical protein